MEIEQAYLRTETVEKLLKSVARLMTSISSDFFCIVRLYKC